MPKALTPAEKKAAAQQPVSESKEVSSEKPTRRRKGSFGGLNKKLDVDYQIEGYHLHW